MSTVFDREQSSSVLEAIFEMRWKLAPLPNQGGYRDPAYPLLYGRLYDRFKKTYSTTEDLPSTQAHSDATPYVPRHCMRAEKGWPLVQVGPGIISVHEGRGYRWESFREEIVQIFEAFTDFYPTSAFALHIVKAELRMIRGIEISEEQNLLELLQTKLNTKVEVDSGLFAPNKVIQNPTGITLNLGFKIEEPVGNAILSIGSGEASDKPAFIVQTLLQSIDTDAPQDLGMLDPWLDEMHLIGKNWFSTLVQKEMPRV